MSEIAEIFGSVEIRVEKLLKKLNSLEANLLQKQSELNKAENIIKNQENEIEALKKACETLKIANSLLGSDENKRDTKLKINSLIREIDYCIAQLSDLKHMDEKLKIKLSIADRVYPLTVEMSQEEGLRSASKKIDIMIKQFEENYAVRDKQDVLAMCALQFASQLEQKQIDNSIDGKETIERMKKINDLLARLSRKKIRSLHRLKYCLH
jgi:cell division protein ZapA (FtsZ GTPase activity inhibitor)